MKRIAGAAALVVAVWSLLVQPVEGAIRWRQYSEKAFADAGSVGAPAVMDFVADWCLPCKEMEVTTYADPDVARESSRFHMFKIDLTDENEANERVSEAFDVRGVPTTIFFNTRGEEVQRLVGYVSIQEMLAGMREAHNGRPDHSESG